MDASDADDRPRPPSEKLAELVARRKAALDQRPRKGAPGPGQSERAAGAFSASRSKPALRK